MHLEPVFFPQRDNGELTPYKKRTFGRKARRPSGRQWLEMKKEESVDERLESFQSYLPPDRQSLCIYEDSSLQDSDSPHIEVSWSHHMTAMWFKLTNRRPACGHVTCLSGCLHISIYVLCLVFCGICAAARHCLHFGAISKWYCFVLLILRQK